MLYIEGKVVKPDRSKADTLLKSSAESGYVPSIVYLKSHDAASVVKNVIDAVKELKDSVNK